VKTIEYGAFGNYGALTMVVYAGSQAQWDAMDIGEYNNNLLAAKLYINGVAQEGSWRIEDGVLYIEEAVGYKETYTPWMNRRQGSSSKSAQNSGTFSEQKLFLRTTSNR